MFKRKLKRTGKCPYCKQEVLPNRVYCDFCGKALPTKSGDIIGVEKKGKEKANYLRNERLNALLDEDEKDTIYDLYKSN